MNHQDVQVLIIGGGPAGLAAAKELAKLGEDRVLVVDREPEMGGIPRHCYHTGFGIFDLKRMLSGPSYARHRVKILRQEKIQLLTNSTVLSWESPLAVRITSPRG